MKQFLSFPARPFLCPWDKSRFTQALAQELPGHGNKCHTRQCTHSVSCLLMGSCVVH